MKKITTLVLAAVILMTASWTGFAATGDIAGKIYSTDIKACINGVWVDSYNIGGLTVVVVEDITDQYRYYEDFRTLVIDDFAPEHLIPGTQQGSQKPGKVIGNIYETDIKTYFRGKGLTSFSLDGKMAVIIEELGMNNAFSETGGRYIWNPELRTITLESAYRYPYSMRTMLEDAGYHINLKKTDDTYSLAAEPVSAPLNGGGILLGEEIPDNTMVPVTYKDEIIGYRCRFPELVMETDEEGILVSRERQTTVEYFYIEKVEDMVFQAGEVIPTVEDWLTYFKMNTMSTIKEQFETEDYLFLYLSSHTPHGNIERLIKISKADGSKLEYSDRFPSVSLHGQKRFDKVEIDRERETVLIHYDKDYIIDLNTDEVREYQQLETDMGVGLADGRPSEYERRCAYGGQREYNLISGDVVKTIPAFGVNEYYYATMLPLKETFEFLNIHYSFENNVLTIDTTDAKPFSLEQTETKVDFLRDDAIHYLYLEKVFVNGEETEITYQYISGHFDRMHTGRAKAKPYVCNGKVYINDSFIRLLYENAGK